VTTDGKKGFITYNKDKLENKKRPLANFKISIHMVKVKVKISLLQAMEAHRVARG
jgi:hypothetical protein